MNGGGMTKPAEAVASIWPSGVEKMQPVRKFYPFFLLHCKRKPWLSELCFACRILCDSAIPQVTFAQSHPMPRWVLLLLLLLSLVPGFYPSLWIVHWHPSNCSLVPFGLCSEPPNVKVGVVVVVVFFGFLLSLNCSLPPLTFVQSNPMQRWVVCLLQNISANF